MLKGLIARPSIVESLNRDGHNRRLEMNGENCGTLLEDLRCAVDRALAFGIENQGPTLAQSEGAGTHGGNEICIGIDNHTPQGTSEAQHDSFAENFAGAHSKNFVEDFRRQNAGEEQGIEITRMIRTEGI